MGRIYERIDDRLASFIEAQPVFFVASAPLEGDGLVNCSPKGNRGELAVMVADGDHDLIAVQPELQLADRGPGPAAGGVQPLEHVDAGEQL